MSTEKKPLLEISELSAGYGGRRVLSDVSLGVREGELVAIVGPNGHGKTTLLRAISGLVAETSGGLRFAGQDLCSLRPDEIVALGIVHVPQGDLLFPEMTVVDNLLVGAHLPQARREAGRRLEEVYALFPKLAERRQQIASTLSGGERRMVGIARGLMGGGRLLMLDEPSLGLAPILIDQIYQAIETLQSAGRTVLLVEENATRASEMADTVHLLDNGEFVWRGSGAELLASPELLSTYLGG